MDKTTKKQLGIGGRGKTGFKTMSDSLNKGMPRTAIADLHKRVKAGDPGAIEEFLNRYYGKPFQSVELSGELNGLPPIPAELIVRIAKDEPKK